MNDEPIRPTRGEWFGNRYISEYLGLEFTLPADWPERNRSGYGSTDTLRRRRFRRISSGYSEGYFTPGFPDMSVSRRDFVSDQWTESISINFERLLTIRGVVPTETEVLENWLFTHHSANSFEESAVEPERVTLGNYEWYVINGNRAFDATDEDGNTYLREFSVRRLANIHRGVLRTITVEIGGTPGFERFDGEGESLTIDEILDNFSPISSESLLLIGCPNDEPNIPTRGEWFGSRYVSEYLEIEFILPKEWDESSRKGDGSDDGMDRFRRSDGYHSPGEFDMRAGRRDFEHGIWQERIFIHFQEVPCNFGELTGTEIIEDWLFFDFRINTSMVDNPEELEVEPEKITLGNYEWYVINGSRINYASSDIYGYIYPRELAVRWLVNIHGGYLRTVLITAENADTPGFERFGDETELLTIDEILDHFSPISTD